MTQQQLETRRERVTNGIWIVSKTEGGFRVYSPTAPTKCYEVSGIPSAPVCTCPDFQAHRADPEWQCKHILTVLTNAAHAVEEPQTDLGFAAEREAIQHEANPPSPPARTGNRERHPDHDAPGTHMLIKRSVSPDGRIDSVSVEFTLPVNGESATEIHAKALRTLQLQNDITASFLKHGSNGNGNSNGKGKSHGFRRVPDADSGPSSPHDQSLPARLIDIGRMDGRYGERLFISVSTNGKRLRLYGTPKQLAAYVGYAGERFDPSEIAPGLRLNLPCRVVLNEGQNGFITVAKVLRLAPPRENGGRQWRSAHS